MIGLISLKYSGFSILSQKIIDIEWLFEINIEINIEQMFTRMFA